MRWVCILSPQASRASPVAGGMYHAPEEENEMIDGWVMMIVCCIIVNGTTVTASSPFIKLYLYLYLFTVTENMRFPDQKTDCFTIAILSSFPHSNLIIISPCPVPHGVKWWEPDVPCTYRDLCHRRETQKLWLSEIIQELQAPLALLPSGEKKGRTFVLEYKEIFSGKTRQKTLGLQPLECKQMSPEEIRLYLSRGLCPWGNHL